MACKAFLDKYPHPTAEQILYHLNGNLCRCGTYKGIREVVAQMSGTKGA
jgi:aerobic-type carbon monoxide dehydrogenase small subunit (CoxS/CutS family)